MIGVGIMPTSLNALLMAWAISLIVIVGGALYLQFTYDEADYVVTETEVGENAPVEAVEDPVNTANEASSADLADNSSEIEAAPAPTGNASAINAFDVALSEDSRDGKLPAISVDGRRPFNHYASKSPANISATLKKIAIVVTDMGRISRTTQLAMDRLPVNATLAFSPYAADVERWGEIARSKGHESLLMVPMEPLNYPQNDPGPLSLLINNSGRQNGNLLKASMARLTGYVGITNSMGSRFTASPDSIRPMLEEVHRRGLMFVDARTSQFSQAAQISSALNMPTALNNGYIDDTPNKTAIENELSRLENRARTLGSAVGFSKLYPISINTIADWASNLEERGFVLVPITQVADTQPLR